MHDDGYFDERVAARYDESAADMFDPVVVDPVVDLLAELADSGVDEDRVLAVAEPWPDIVGGRPFRATVSRQSPVASSASGGVTTRRPQARVELPDQPVLVEDRESEVAPAALGGWLVHLERVLEVEELLGADAVVDEPVDGRQQRRAANGAFRSASLFSSAERVDPGCCGHTPATNLAGRSSQ